MGQGVGLRPARFGVVRALDLVVTGGIVDQDVDAASVATEERRGAPVRRAWR